MVLVAGYEGFVESDFNAINNGGNAALTGTDLDMPLSAFFNAATPEPAITSGVIPISLIDDKVRRILREVAAFGFLDRAQQLPIALHRPESENAALQGAQESIVLLKNANSLLPLQRNTHIARLARIPRAYLRPVTEAVTSSLWSYTGEAATTCSNG
jgi:beta-glucosidase-like glycosyl hydrolase